MKYIKMIGLAVVAAATLMSFAVAASATVLEDSSGNLPKGSKIDFTGANIVMKAGFETLECSHSAMSGTTSNAGGAGETVETNLSTLAFSNCKPTIHVFQKGRLIFHYTSGSNGTVTHESGEWTIATSMTSCTYGTPTATDIGTLSGGGPAVLNVSASLTKISGGFLCSNPATWTAKYTTTSPNPMYVTAR